MTLADPHGRPQDRLRNCYASWMNTPDAGRIRIRWYRIPDPAPGMFELSDYSSSNYDPTPHSQTPVVGEDSVDRDPFGDYRPCCPPPWAHPSITDCPNAAAPAWLRYTAPAVTWGSDLFASADVPAQTLTRFSPCRWRHANFIADGVTWNYDLRILPDQSVTLTVVAGPVLGVFRGAVYASPGPADPGGPMTLRLTPGADLIGPPFIRVNGTDPPYLLVAPCTWLKLGEALYLRLGV